MRHALGARSLQAAEALFWEHEFYDVEIRADRESRRRASLAKKDVKAALEALASVA
jgi:hypothetical protein